MKKFIFGSVVALLTLGLMACGGSGEPTPNEGKDDDTVLPNPDDGKEDGTGEDSEKDEETKEDFTIKTSDNGLNALESEYTFSTVKEGDSFPPEAKIRLLTDESWRLVTQLNDNYTRIVAEDTSVLPEGSVSTKIVTKSSVFGSSSTNEIYAIDLVFDRSLIKPGTSKLKLEVRPSNGSSTVNKLTTICVDVTVKEYGDILVDTYNVSLDVDLTGLDEIIDKALEVEPEYINLTLTDDATLADVYGYSADYTKSADIPVSDTYTSAKLEDVKFAVGHTYLAFIFVQGVNNGGRAWVALEAKATSSDYKLEDDPDVDGQSLLKVSKDNVTIEAELGGYTAYNF